jgi:hypothetical protein
MLGRSFVRSDRNSRLPGAALASCCYPLCRELRNLIPIRLADKSVFHPVVHPEIPYRTDKITAVDSCRFEIKFSRSGRP